MPKWISFSKDYQYIYFKISELMNSQNVTLQAKADYKGVLYTKLYKIYLKGCDAQDCKK